MGARWARQGNRRRFRWIERGYHAIAVATQGAHAIPYVVPIQRRVWCQDEAAMAEQGVQTGRERALVTTPRVRRCAGSTLRASSTPSAVLKSAPDAGMMHKMILSSPAQIPTRNQRLLPAQHHKLPALHQVLIQISGRVQISGRIQIPGRIQNFDRRSDISDRSAALHCPAAHLRSAPSRSACALVSAHWFAPHGWRLAPAHESPEVRSEPVVRLGLPPGEVASCVVPWFVSVSCRAVPRGP